MFMGHYGPAVWDTQRGHGAPIITLWQGFIAVQLIDIIFSILVIFGLEGDMRFLNAQPIFDIPYSHSLLTSILWSLLGGLGFYFLKPSSGKRGFWVFATLVFSHWLFDLLVHRPDLPLYPGSEIELGLGLWNWPWPSFVLEMGLLGAGLAFWQRVTTGSRRNSLMIWALFLVMGVLQFSVITGPGLAVQAGTFDPSTVPQGPMVGVGALLVFFGITLAIAKLEKTRPPKLN